MRKSVYYWVSHWSYGTQFLRTNQDLKCCTKVMAVLLTADVSVPAAEVWSSGLLLLRSLDDVRLVDRSKDVIGRWTKLWMWCGFGVRGPSCEVVRAWRSGCVVVRRIGRPSPVVVDIGFRWRRKAGEVRLLELRRRNHTWHRRKVCFFYTVPQAAYVASGAVRYETGPAFSLGCSPKRNHA